MTQFLVFEKKSVIQAIQQEKNLKAGKWLSSFVNGCELTRLSVFANAHECPACAVGAVIKTIALETATLSDLSYLATRVSDNLIDFSDKNTYEYDQDFIVDNTEKYKDEHTQYVLWAKQTKYSCEKHFRDNDWFYLLSTFFERNRSNDYLPQHTVTFVEKYFPETLYVEIDECEIDISVDKTKVKIATKYREFE